MKFRFRALFGLLISSLALAACQIVVETQVETDGSGTLRTSVVYSAEEKQNFDQSPDNAGKSICDNLKNDVPAGAAFTEEVHEGDTYCVTARNFGNLSDLRKLYSGMKGVTVNQLEVDLGRFSFDVDVDLSDSAEGQGVVNEWQLTLPGTMGDHNADRVEGQTLIWVVSPGEKANLHAESAAGMTLKTLGPTGALILAGVCVVGAALGAGGFYVVARRRGSGGKA